MKTFNTEQLTRFKEYTERNIADAKADLKSADAVAFDATFTLLNALNDQATLIQQHIDADSKPKAAKVTAGKVELTSEEKAQKKAAEKAAKETAKTPPTANT